MTQRLCETMDLLSAGRVGRPHGLDGSFHVTRPRPLLLVLGGMLRIGGLEREIVRRAGTEDRPILRCVVARGAQSEAFMPGGRSRCSDISGH